MNNFWLNHPQIINEMIISYTYKINVDRGVGVFYATIAFNNKIFVNL